MPRTRVKKYRHEVRVLDSGDLEPRCLEDGAVHWAGDQFSQEHGVVRAHAAAIVQLNDHIDGTGHVRSNR